MTESRSHPGHLLSHPHIWCISTSRQFYLPDMSWNHFVLHLYCPYPSSHNPGSNYCLPVLSQHPLISLVEYIPLISTLHLSLPSSSNLLYAAAKVLFLQTQSSHKAPLFKTLPSFPISLRRLSWNFFQQPSRPWLIWPIPALKPISCHSLPPCIFPSHTDFPWFV